MESRASYRLEIIGDTKMDPTNDNVDVWVHTEDGSRYSATFFTLKNVETLMNRWRESGEHSGGVYFWCVDAIIVRELTEEAIRRSVDDLMATGQFFRAFGGPYEN